MTKRAIYAGSFDPITYGHLDILSRARALFDEVIVAVNANGEKRPIFSIDQRIQLIQSSLGNKDGYQVVPFSGLLVDFAAQNNVFTLIRGLRMMSDFEFEFQMALTNRKLNPKIDTIFLMTDEKFFYTSSSVVRQVAANSGDIRSFVPQPVEQALKDYFK